MWTAFFSKRFKLYRVRSIRTVYHVLWASLAMLFICNLYRAIEFTVDTVAHHEWVFYVFDTIVIFLCIVLFCVFHFGRILPHKGLWVKELEAHKEAGSSTEMEVTIEADLEAATASDDQTETD